MAAREQDPDVNPEGGVRASKRTRKELFFVSMLLTNSTYLALNEFGFSTFVKNKCQPKKVPLLPFDAGGYPQTPPLIG
jgi:hypothetical protein